MGKCLSHKAIITKEIAWNKVTKALANVLIYHGKS